MAFAHCMISSLFRFKTLDFEFAELVRRAELL